jgi:hypothetical protein
MTPKQEIRMLDWIVRRVARLSEPSRVWLMKRLVAVECGDIPVRSYLQIGWRDAPRTDYYESEQHRR